MLFREIIVVSCHNHTKRIINAEWGGIYSPYYRGAGKSLARPGRKQATATEDFDVHIFLIPNFRRVLNAV
jgi:hypothetical protein